MLTLKTFLLALFLLLASKAVAAEQYVCVFRYPKLQSLEGEVVRIRPSQLQAVAKVARESCPHSQDCLRLESVRPCSPSARALSEEGPHWAIRGGAPESTTARGWKAGDGRDYDPHDSSVFLALKTKHHFEHKLKQQVLRKQKAC